MTHSSPSAPKIPAWQEIATVALLCSSHLLTQAALGQAIAPLLIISEDLGSTSFVQTGWYVAAYSMTVGTFILVAGRLGDAYGHRMLIIIGYVWFALWSMIGGFGVYAGQSFFIVCRAFQGLGPAILLPNSLAILGTMFPPGMKKNISFSLFGAAAPNGFILGSLFSSLLAQLAWWPWAYWILAIVCAVMAILVYLVVPSQPRHNRPRLAQLDVLGSITGTIGLVLFNFAWNQGAAVGWSVPYTYVILIVGVVFLCLFVWAERRSLDPIIPTHVLNLDTIFVLTCMACGWASFGIWLFYAWQVSEQTLRYTPLSVVAQFTPVGISGFLAAFSLALLIPRLAPFNIMNLAMTAFLVGSVLFATAPVGQIYWAQRFLSIAIMPWGMDLSYPAGMILLSNASPNHHQGIAASLLNTVVNYSISIGIGIAGTVESNVNRGGTDQLRGFRGAQYVGIALAAMGLVVSLIYTLVGRLRRPVSPLASIPSLVLEMSPIIEIFPVMEKSHDIEMSEIAKRGEEDEGTSAVATAMLVL